MFVLLNDPLRDVAQLLRDTVIFETSPLKGLAQAKIIKKSMILFWLLNMTI